VKKNLEMTKSLNIELQKTGRKCCFQIKINFVAELSGSRRVRTQQLRPAYLMQQQSTRKIRFSG